MYLRIVFIALFCLFCHTTSFAKNRCKQLLINVANHSHQACRLVYLGDTHATLTQKSISRELAPGTALHLEAWQNFYAGPSLMLGFVCGESFIMIQSQQGMCLFFGTQTQSHIIEQDKNISLQVVSTQDSSLLQNLPGIISWEINDA